MYNLSFSCGFYFKMLCKLCYENFITKFFMAYFWIASWKFRRTDQYEYAPWYCKAAQSRIWEQLCHYYSCPTIWFNFDTVYAIGRLHYIIFSCIIYHSSIYTMYKLMMIHYAEFDIKILFRFPSILYAYRLYRVSATLHENEAEIEAIFRIISL